LCPSLKSQIQDVLLAEHHLLAAVVLVEDHLRVDVVLDVGHIHRFTCMDEEKDKKKMLNEFYKTLPIDFY